MDILKRGKITLLLESDNLKTISELLDGNFEKAVEELFNARGRVITSGVGKSGHIARKAAATFASTGTPSFFVDPTECLHGDFGMITKDDYMLLYSKAGESLEIIEIVNWLCRQNIPYVAITNEEKSTLAQHAKVTLLIHVKEEACPLKLAPTVSTTASLALSDALAAAIMERRGFKAEDFAVFHPAGSLGKQLAKISSVMHKGKLPIVRPNATLHDTLFTIIEHKLGLAIVADENNVLRGIIVDGDLKRLLVNSLSADEVLSRVVEDVMNKNPTVIEGDALVGQALFLMEGKITSIIVVEPTEIGDVPIGVVHIHDILKLKAF